MEAYSILLPNEKKRTYQYITLFILLINCFAWGVVLLNAANEKVKYLAALAAGISFISLIFFLVQFYTKRLIAYRTGISFIILGICWLLSGRYLFALCIICFAILGFYSSKKFNVIFSAEKILYPTFPVKTYLWTEVSNVILKDNVLTIDLKNNKLIQVVIEKDPANEINEDQFNDFCRKQMSVTTEAGSR